ncbi:MAG TPA: DUF4256 domain-containing protein [Bacteroidales bacterium]|nr:DUF4256 domain-containing protein [Bacteroidales bacterium]
MEKQMLTRDQVNDLVGLLKARFGKNRERHDGMAWQEVEVRLLADPGKLWSLSEMEATGGEPDVTGVDRETGEFIFTDCSPESPAGRRSLCYDREGLESRKEFKPANNAMDLAAAMGIDMLTEEQYRALQQMETFDSKTSSWIRTPDSIRSLGGALFADFRYGRVFIYHNSAPSYYNSRGFRGCLKV